MQKIALWMLSSLLSRKLKDPELCGIFSTGTDEHGMKVQQAAQITGYSVIFIIIRPHYSLCARERGKFDVKIKPTKSKGRVIIFCLNIFTIRKMI